VLTHADQAVSRQEVVECLPPKKARARTPWQTGSLVAWEALGTMAQLERRASAGRAGLPDDHPWWRPRWLWPPLELLLEQWQQPQARARLRPVKRSCRHDPG